MKKVIAAIILFSAGGAMFGSAVYILQEEIRKRDELLKNAVLTPNEIRKIKYGLDPA